MEEIRARLDAVESLYNSATKIPGRVAIESCVLQLRLICESISLGCLVAHGDLKEIKSSRLQKAYEADFIIKALERLHADFYPVPHEAHVQESSASEGRLLHYEDKSSSYLNKEDLVKLYRRTGVVLHRGILKSLFKNPEKESDLREEVNLAHNKIVELLRSRHVITKDRDFVMVCSISESEKVHVAFAGRMPPGDCGCSNLLIHEPVFIPQG